MAHSDQGPIDTAALAGVLSSLRVACALPFDRGLPGTDGSRRTRECRSEPGLGSALASLAAASGFEPIALIEALWGLILSRHSGEPEVVLGSVRAAGQGVNAALPIGFCFAPDHSLVGQAAATASFFARGAGAPQSAPFESVVAIHRPGAAPLANGAPCALVVEVECGSCVGIRLDADAARFDDDGLDRLGEQLLTGLREVTAKPGVAVRDVTLLSERERRLVVEEWNARSAEPASEAQAVPVRVSARAGERPQAIAVRAQGRQLSYAELEARATALAAHLVSYGLAPDDTVALCLPRTPDLIVALLAILKAGAAYLPIEPGYPAKRVAFMLEDAKPKLALTDRQHRSVLGDTSVAVIELDGPLGSAVGQLPTLDPEHLAYVLYTSGSTGVPKGVRVPHRAIDRLVWKAGYARLGPDTCILQSAPVAFDASTFEIWGALVNGGTVALYPDPVPTAAGLKRAIREHGVTTLWLTAALFNAVIDSDPNALEGARQVLTGGEALSVEHIRRAQAALPNVELIDGYGPTETTTFATCFSIPRPLPEHLRAIPIGRAIRQTRLYVLDDARRPVPAGAVGELYIGGQGVARGYLARPELTEERFLANPFVPDEVVYRTGDVVRFGQDGVVEYVGRRDQQVKVRGFRIELGEVEAACARIRHVRSAVVVARPSEAGDKRLIAYVVPEPERTLAPSDLRRALVESLPEHMVPAVFVAVREIPLTLNGKVDYRALPEPDRERPELSVEFVEARGPAERQLAKLWAEALELKAIGVLDNLFELGASSLLVVRTLARLEREHGLSIPVLRVFETPTVAGMAAFLEAGEGPGVGRGRPRTPPRSGLDTRVAIIGMAGRFPGARNVRELWKNLCQGVESISFFERSELSSSGRAELADDPAYVRARGIIEDVDLFDPSFFGITPKEARLMDPQQRVLLEVAWETLESAAYTPERFDGTIGIFAGKYNNTYYSENVVGHPELISELGAFQTMVANEKDYVATRIAHRLGLTGPAISVHTACSTSLVAVVQACQNLILRQCDMALAGGVSITVPVKSGHLYQEGAMLSADGHTRSFDADAQGTVFSDGAAMVLLKRLDDALADGDTVYGVIRGGATNNDGADKASFTAPSIEGQVAVIRTALAVSGVSPDEVGFVEAHGTATPLGDPIEVEALTRAFREGTERSQYCALGSIKSNLGHLVIAAGAAGLIKTALCLSTRTLVPSLHFRRKNAKIDFANTPFLVNTRQRPWEAPRGVSRIAGVSSFGVGGTNAHVIVEEPPVQVHSDKTRDHELLVLSGRSEKALAEAARRLASHLTDHPDVPLRDVAFSLLEGRKAFPLRRAVVAKDAAEAAQALRQSLPARRADPARVRAAFLFPGQGAQYPGMGATLYREQPVFRAHVDAAAEVLKPALGRDLRELLFPAPGAEARAATELAQTAFAQPALYVVEHALALLWRSFGVSPAFMIGHSVGEFVCATLASVMGFEDALRIVAARGKMMQEMPSGAMLSVRLAAEEVASRLPAEVCVAADNSPGLCVVAGPHGAVAEAQKTLEGQGVMCRLLQTSHAFHSPMMDPVVPRLQKELAEVRLRAPETPFVSTATGDWITAEQATSPAYWASHLRSPVRFRAGVKRLLDEDGAVLLEVGPRATLATLARQQATGPGRQRCLSSMGDTDRSAWQTLLGAAGQLWSLGVGLDAAGLCGPQPRRRVSLPTYPFDQKRCWVDPKDIPAEAPGAVALPDGRPRAAVSQAEAAQALTSDTEVSMPSATREQVLQSLATLLEEASGLEVGPGDAQTSFVELGLDSLFLTQFALMLRRKFELKITFRQLLERFPTMASLAEHIESNLPADAEHAPAKASTGPTVAAAPAPGAPALLPSAQTGPATLASGGPAGDVQQLIQQQLQLMAQQLALLGGAAPQPAAPGPHVVAQPAAPAPASAFLAGASGPEKADAGDDEGAVSAAKYDVKKAFGAIARITTATAHDELSPLQRARLDAFTRRYNDKTKGSKRFAQESRRVMADPRAVTGFRPLIKELVYPLVVDRSKGAKLWDVDGNEYVDALNGFGLSLFGWQPDFVTRAIEEQLHRGHEIGPQHPLQAEVAQLICEVTGFDRAGFCNTGSEAVMGCARIARTVTGRQKIAIFTGGYHGIFDEVVVRGTKKLRSIPAAPGIMPNTAENVLVLEYGTEQSLEILRSQAEDLAAIIVEPVQSRRPDFQPREFIHALRELTTRHGIVYVFDEVVTGFRTGPGGAQEFYGVKADLASYGKVIGGGLPIGVIAGRADLMDALDGGQWQFGDDSVPPVGVTYFAGTFVRHPLALAAAKAVLTRIKELGPSLQRDLNARTSAFASELNAFAQRVGAPLEVKHFASLWKTFWSSEQSFGDLLFYLMRDRGVHIYDGFPCFFTTAHGEAEFAHVAKAFKDSVLEMQDAGFLPERKAPPIASAADSAEPPAPGARLGRDPSGNPAWYVPHPSEPNKYVKLEVN